MNLCLLTIHSRSSCHFLNHLLAQTSKGESEGAVHSKSKKLKKSARSKTSETPKAKDQGDPSPSKEILSAPRLRKDFCNVPLLHMKYPCTSYKGVGLLDDSGHAILRVWNPPASETYRNKQNRSLKHLIDPGFQKDMALSNGSSTFDTLRLAKTLAIALP